MATESGGRAARGVLMFDRYTDRARKAMGLARQEAQRLNHEYVGTEHIALGLTLETSGVACTALENLGVPHTRLREEVLKLVTSGGSAVTMGQLPFTPRAKAALDHALSEASALRHNYIGTEHLLLGLLKVEDGTIAVALANCDLSLERVREEVLAMLGDESPVRTEPAGFVIADTSTDEDRKQGRLKIDLKMDLPAVMQEFLYAQVEVMRAKAAQYAECGACDKDQKVQRWYSGGVGPYDLDFTRHDCPNCSGGDVRTMHMQYRNHRGEVAVREVVPGALYWSLTAYYPTERWLMRAWDMEKGATRDYDMGEVTALDMRHCHCDGPNETPCGDCGDSGWLVGDKR